MPLLPHPIIRKILSELDPLTFFLSPLQLTMMMTYKTETKLEWCHFKNRMSKKLNLLDPFYDGKLVNSLANIHTYKYRNYKFGPLTCSRPSRSTSTPPLSH